MPSVSTARKNEPKQAGEHVDKSGGKGPAEDAGLSRRAVPTPRVHLPSGAAGNVVWWGGLAAVAAFGVVDWPVVALVAAGTWVAEQHANQRRRAQAARA